MAKIEGPDQPRSWIIAMAACVINTLLSGISRATGIFYVALIDGYGVSRLEANMPFTLRNVTRNLAGPAVGILGQKYGVKVITFYGAILATAGISLCSLAPNVLWVTIFWGGFHGLGVAFANTLFQVTVNQYFVKYRATASGIALSGACLGSFVFPVALEKFLNNFGLSGTFLMTGGLIMQVIPASILLTEPPWLQDPKPHQRHPVKPGVSKLETIEETNGKELPETFNAKTKEFLDVETKMSTRNSISNPELEKQICNGSSLRKSSGGLENPTFTGSLVDVNDKLRDKRLESTLSSRRSRTISASEISVTIPAEELQNSPKDVSLWKCICHVYRNPMFHVISLAFGTFGLLFDPLMTVIVDYINDKGLDDHVGKYLISVLSLGDLVGRMCFGWVTDKGYMSLPKFICLSQVIQGISFVLLPSFFSFEALMGAAILFGVGAGTTIIMFPLLLAKYLANEQALAIGCMSFFGGIMSFAAAPLIGHFRDQVGSYDGMFYITGGLSIIVGFSWLLEPFLVRHDPCKSRTEVSAESS